MKKNLIILSCFLFTQISLADRVKTLSCMTEFPTTTVFAETVGTELVATVYHHNGFEFMPLHTGMVTPRDLDHLAKKAQVFQELGNEYVFRWDLNKCVTLDNVVFTCLGGKDTTINGKAVRPFSISTSRIQAVAESGTYDTVEVSFLLDIDNTSQSFSMIYQNTECSSWKTSPF